MREPRGSLMRLAYRPDPAVHVGLHEQADPPNLWKKITLLLRCSV